MLKIIRYLWQNEDGFFGLGQGPSSEEKQQFRSLAGAANFATGQGEGDILSADKFWQSILSGDPSQISKVLGPLTSGINKQGQQAKKTAAEFGNRGGGTNAAMQMEDTNTRTAYDSLVSDLTGKAASALGASGSSLLAAGVSAHEGAFSEANTIQQQRAAQLDDIFKSITQIAGAFVGGFGGGSPAAASPVGTEADLMRQIS
jgi:hypothetical protein